MANLIQAHSEKINARVQELLSNSREAKRLYEMAKDGSAFQAKIGIIKSSLSPSEKNDLRYAIINMKEQPVSSTTSEAKSETARELDELARKSRTRQTHHVHKHKIEEKAYEQTPTGAAYNSGMIESSTVNDRFQAYKGEQNQKKGEFESTQNYNSTRLANDRVLNRLGIDEESELERAAIKEYAKIDAQGNRADLTEAQTQAVINTRDKALAQKQLEAKKNNNYDTNLLNKYDAIDAALENHPALARAVSENLSYEAYSETKTVVDTSRGTPVNRTVVTEFYKPIASNASKAEATMINYIRQKLNDGDVSYANNLMNAAAEKFGDSFYAKVSGAYLITDLDNAVMKTFEKMNPEEAKKFETRHTDHKSYAQGAQDFTELNERIDLRIGQEKAGHEAYKRAVRSFEIATAAMKYGINKGPSAGVSATPEGDGASSFIGGIGVNSN